MAETSALAAMSEAGLTYRIIRHGQVSSLAEAAAARGVQVRDVVKTLVIRRGEADYAFVLVPGNRILGWPKLRALLGVNRISLPDADEAWAATGYRRGTITPFGAKAAWPVIADERLADREITLGTGEYGVAVAVAANPALAFLQARVADVSEPEAA
jgi:Cys-tRNA(Pro) deacylase